MALTKLDKASRIAIKDCMGAKKKEKILVVDDEESIVKILVHVCQDLKMEAWTTEYFMVLEEPGRLVLNLTFNIEII